MMQFFDYTYYKICEFYSKYEKVSETTGLIVLAMMYNFNLLSLFFLFSIIVNTNIHFSILLIIILYIILVVLNGIRYNKISYGILEKRWQDEDKNVRLKKSCLVLAYIILSTIIFFGLAIYHGSKK